MSKASAKRVWSCSKYLRAIDDGPSESVEPEIDVRIVEIGGPALVIRNGLQSTTGPRDVDANGAALESIGLEKKNLDKIEFRVQTKGLKLGFKYKDLKRKQTRKGQIVFRSDDDFDSFLKVLSKYYPNVNRSSDPVASTPTKSRPVTLDDTSVPETPQKSAPSTPPSLRTAPTLRPNLAQPSRAVLAQPSIFLTQPQQRHLSQPSFASFPVQDSQTDSNGSNNVYSQPLFARPTTIEYSQPPPRIEYSPPLHSQQIMHVPMQAQIIMSQPTDELRYVAQSPMFAHPMAATPTRFQPIPQYQDFGSPLISRQAPIGSQLVESPILYAQSPKITVQEPQQQQQQAPRFSPVQQRPQSQQSQHSSQNHEVPETPPPNPKPAQQQQQAPEPSIPATNKRPADEPSEAANKRPRIEEIEQAPQPQPEQQQEQPQDKPKEDDPLVGPALMAVFESVVKSVYESKDLEKGKDEYARYAAMTDDEMTDLIKKTVADDKFKVFCERLEGLWLARLMAEFF